MSPEPSFHMIESPPVGSRPRAWSEVPEDILAIEIPLMIGSAGAWGAVSHALRSEGELSDAELAALGRLNFYAYLKSFEPPVALLSDRTALDPTFAAVVSHLTD